MGCTIQGHKTGDLCQSQLLGDHLFSYLTPISIRVSGISQQFQWNIATGFHSCFCQALLGDGGGARRAVAAVAMSIIVGSHRSWLCVRPYGFELVHAAPIVRAPLAESPGREHPSCLLLASQGCCSLTSLAGEIKKSVQCFGCMGTDIQLGQGKPESVLNSSPHPNTGPGGVQVCMTQSFVCFLLF